MHTNTEIENHIFFTFEMLLREESEQLKNLFYIKSTELLYPLQLTTFHVVLDLDSHAKASEQYATYIFLHIYCSLSRT